MTTSCCKSEGFANIRRIFILIALRSDHVLQLIDSKHFLFKCPFFPLLGFKLVIYKAKTLPVFS